MAKNSKSKSVTMVGGKNIAPPETKEPKTKPPKEPNAEKTAE